MKKIIAAVLCVIILSALCACQTGPVKPVRTIETESGSYEEMSDGTWRYGGRIYQYRLELSGRYPNSIVDSTMVLLCNRDDVTFEEVAEAMFSDKAPLDFEEMVPVPVKLTTE